MNTIKNLLSIFVIITSLTFISCENEPIDSSLIGANPAVNNSGGNGTGGGNIGGGSTSNTLLRKVIETDSGGEAITYEYFYNGNKINYITDNDGGLSNKSVFVYNNNLIATINSYSDNVLSIKEEFTYDSSSRLTEYKQFDITDTGEINHEYKITFVHNSNTSINYEMRSIIPSAGINEIESTGVINLDTNQNVISNTATDTVLSITRAYTYTFDNKNNPYKNIVGIDKIRYSWPSDQIDGSILNNVLNVNENGNPYSITTYNYNSLNFPSTSSSNQDGEIFNSQYFYN